MFNNDYNTEWSFTINGNQFKLPVGCLIWDILTEVYESEKRSSKIEMTAYAGKKMETGLEQNIEDVRYVDVALKK